MGHSVGEEKRERERERGAISMIQMEKEPGKRTSRKSMDKAKKG